jgi:hypothetical protein
MNVVWARRYLIPAGSLEGSRFKFYLSLSFFLLITIRKFAAANSVKKKKNAPAQELLSWR